MNSAKILIEAYFEKLHQILSTNKSALQARVDKIIQLEVRSKGFDLSDREKLCSYQQTSYAFIEERIEMYNPIGIQRAYPPHQRKAAAEFEFEIDWYNSRAEFQQLLETASEITKPDMNDAEIKKAVSRLIQLFPAYPDGSIITGYKDRPDLLHLPDYAVSKAIEELLDTGRTE